MRGSLALGLLLAGLAAAGSPLERLEPVDGFAELDLKAEPGGFGLLLVQSGGEGDLRLAERLLDAVSSLPRPDSIALYRLPPDAPGRPEVAALCTEFGVPGVTVLVGHCGFLELNPDMLATEVMDAWTTWGDPDSRRTGICNFCRRCNP
jgi:hypothetical protein